MQDVAPDPNVPKRVGIPEQCVTGDDEEERKKQSEYNDGKGKQRARRQADLLPRANFCRSCVHLEPISGWRSSPGRSKAAQVAAGTFAHYSILSAERQHAQPPLKAVRSR